MKLISQVKISYFRSIYSGDILGCSSLNIITGKNDSGKSNILRALNLFFNGHTDFYKELDFLGDFSIRRKDEVKKTTIKGKQFISIEVEFNRPDNFRGSLPPKFSVTRKWHRNDLRYDQTNNLESINRIQPLPGKLSTAERSLSALLSRIHYEYIPAVKDRNYFRHLLQRLQQTLLETAIEDEEDIDDVAQRLAEQIQGKIVELRSDFKRATNLDTDINPPKRLSSLFQAFEVGTNYSDEKVALNNRGDGIQTRFVPCVLNYIANAVPSVFFIWGYEEPENSLEINSIDALMTDIQEIYSKKSQIFLTSHAPGIIACIGDDISGYRVVNDGKSSLVRSISNSAQKRLILADDIGHLESYKRLRKLYRNELDKQRHAREMINKLEAEMAELQKPLLLVEGDTDKIILEICYKKIFKTSELPMEIRSSNVLFEISKDENAGGCTMLVRAIESFHPQNKRRALALFDADDDGKKSYGQLSANFTDKSSYKAHSNGHSFAMVIPRIKGCENYYDNHNLCIEYLFPRKFLNSKNDKGYGLEFELPNASLVVSGKKREIKLTEEQTIHLQWLEKIKSGKMIFAKEIVTNATESDLVNIKKLISIVCIRLAISNG